MTTFPVLGKLTNVKFWTFSSIYKDFLFDWQLHWHNDPWSVILIPYPWSLITDNWSFPKLNCCHFDSKSPTNASDATLRNCCLSIFKSSGSLSLSWGHLRDLGPCSWKPYPRDISSPCYSYSNNEFSCLDPNRDGCMRWEWFIILCAPYRWLLCYNCSLPWWWWWWCVLRLLWLS